jgi:adenylate cyclase class 2
MKEIEVKLRVLDHAFVVQRLAELGWRARGQRDMERNFVYDKPDGTLKEAGCLLRVRDAEGRCRLTLKLPISDAGPHKVREEHEIEASDCAALQQILDGLGYVVAWRYEKFRTYYERTDAAGQIVLDETPIGDFLELEGEPSWIDRTAVELRYAPLDYITATYRELFEDYRLRNRRVGTHMVFTRGGKPRLHEA